MVHDGNYSRYFDGFQRAATTWHSTWRNISILQNIKNTLSLRYIYLCLYANTFSFQAVLMRTSASRRQGKKSHLQRYSRVGSCCLQKFNIFSMLQARPRRYWSWWMVRTRGRSCVICRLGITGKLLAVLHRISRNDWICIRYTQQFSCTRHTAWYILMIIPKPWGYESGTEICSYHGRYYIGEMHIRRK